MDFKELFKGIDSLYVSYKGTLKQGLRELLEEKKTLAQSDSEKERALATMDIDDHHFEVKDRGARYYSYILEDNWYHIQITASKKNTVPTMYVQIASELLNCLGHEYAIYKLREIVNKMLIVIEAETISRADIFVDFATNMDFEKIEKQSWITRAEDTLKRWKRETFTGWSIGYGGHISARLYDKTVEIKKSGKEYLHEIWVNQGWDKEQGVWRLEFQLRREFLGQMSIKMFSDLLSKVNDVWRYCTCDWLRLAINDDTQNRTRWKTDPLWEMIQQVSFLGGTYTGITREVNKARIPSDKILYQNGIVGYMTSFAAREGLDVVDEEAVMKCWEEAQNHLKRETRGKDKDYLSTKINLKKKKYNMAKDTAINLVKDLKENS